MWSANFLRAVARGHAKRIQDARRLKPEELTQFQKLSLDEQIDIYTSISPSDQQRLIEKAFEGLSPKQREQSIKALAGVLKRQWIPLPGPQTRAAESQADILFYGGAAGGGKSSMLCGVAVTQHKKSRIFRRESVQTRGLADEISAIVGGRKFFNSQENIWRLKDGQTIQLAHCQYEDDKQKYMGNAADLIGFDEITHFTESQFRYLIGWNRSAEPGQRSRVICTGNPPATSEGRWVLAFWSPWLDPDHPNPAKDGELRWFTTINGVDEEVDGPGPHGFDELGNPIMAKSRTFIRSLLSDNPYLVDAGYTSSLQSMPEPLRSMMLLGKFDLAIDDAEWQVIPSSWIEQAQRRWTDTPPSNYPMTAMGVDIAVGGKDDTVLAPRYGRWFGPLVALSGVDNKNSAAMAGMIFATMRDGCCVAVDVGGGWGADVFGHLKGQNVNSVPVNWVEASSETIRHGQIRFLNKRAEAWWRFREALDPINGENVALPPDKTLAADLASPLWGRTPSGLIKIEEKSEIKKRLGRSPDRGDAVVMAWMHGGLETLDQKRRAHMPSEYGLSRPSTYGQSKPRASSYRR